MRPVTERVLTQRELNRALLARQLLLEPTRLPLPRAVERMGCVQSQYAPSTYVGLWSRVAGLERDAVTRALERRTLVQGTLMRNTIHVVSRRDYWPLAIAIREERRAWSQRVQKPDERELRRAAERLRRFLAGGPRRQREIQEAGLWLPGIGLWTNLVRVPPCGTWERRRADLFGLAEEWVGPEPELSELDAREHLVRRYLGAFGPAPRTDIADWAGMRVGALGEALERHGRSAASVTSRAASCSTCRARRCRRPTHRRRCGSSPPSTPPCWCTRGAPGSSPSEHRKRIFHVQKPAVGPDVPRRRPGRRYLAARGRPRSCWSRSAGSPVTLAESSRRKASG